MTDNFLGVGGTDGTNARPLKMDVEGNLEVRDIDVKAELELIKDQQAEILSRLGEPIGTQLTGSKVEEKTLVYRTIRNASTFDIPTTFPDGAKGVYIECVVHGVTGTFEAEEGLSFDAGFFPTTRSVWIKRFRTKADPRAITHSLLFYPGVGGLGMSGEATEIINDNKGFINTHLFGRFSTRVNITGSYNEGEGFDFEVKARWLL